MMEIKEQPKLRFHGVDILNINFNTIAPREKRMDVQIQCTSSVFYLTDNKCVFKIVMGLEVKDEPNFTLKIDAVGNFELDDELTDELKKNFVNENAPAIMFPYVRAFITTLTANMGKTVGVIILPSFFFKGNIKELGAENKTADNN